MLQHYLVIGVFRERGILNEVWN